MSFKDQFSEQAIIYAKSRPGYPDSIFQFLDSLVAEKHRALDCATGNGQTAVSLSNYFALVFASDPSREQLSQALRKSNIIYLQSTAEKISLKKNTLDLITISQAIHWVTFSQFYEEVNQLLKPSGVLAFWGYNLPRIDAAMDEIVNHLYSDILGRFWHKERKYIDAEYQTIPLPFTELKTPEFQMTTQWSFERFIGYLKSWSAVQNYSDQTKKDPLEFVEKKLSTAWGKERIREINWPLFMRVGRV